MQERINHSTRPMTWSWVNNHASRLVNDHKCFVLVYYVEGYLFRGHLHWLCRRNNYLEFIAGETLALDVAIDGEIDDETFAHLRDIEIDGMLGRIGLSMVTK